MICPNCKENHSLSQCPRWRVPTTIALMLALAGCATSIQVPAQRVAECKAHGGCMLVTQDELDGAIVEAAQFGANEVLKQMDSNGCRKGSL